MFLENVKHILKVGDGNVIKYIDEQLDRCGYKVERYVMSPHYYGIPQNRERVYFICVRKDIWKEGFTINIPDKRARKSIDMSSFLENDPDPKYKIGEQIEKVLNAWDEMIKEFEVGQKINPTIMCNYFKTPIDEIDVFAKWKQDYIKKNRQLYEKHKDKWDAWKKRHKTTLSKREIYAQLDWQAGEKKKDDTIFDHFIQIRQSGVRVKRATVFPTLVAISQIPIYGTEKRYITPRECARIQSFPDEFILSENDKISYKQLGNSVNVHNVNTVTGLALSYYS
jgi:DNA (cytosine-5)-methyltransferase 1